MGVVVGLDNPKSNVNVASALRACGVYGANMLCVRGSRYKHHGADTMHHYKQLPLVQVDDLKEVIPYRHVPVAVDLIEGAISLPEYKHPKHAFYIFGAEDATLGDRIISWCRDVVYIPTDRCMNLAATVNVVLYDRLSKEKPQ